VPPATLGNAVPNIDENVTGIEGAGQRVGHFGLDFAVKRVEAFGEVVERRGGCCWLMFGHFADLLGSAHESRKNVLPTANVSKLEILAT
jgi:hypothetical protein